MVELRLNCFRETKRERKGKEENREKKIFPYNPYIRKENKRRKEPKERKRKRKRTPNFFYFFF